MSDRVYFPELIQFPQTRWTMIDRLGFDEPSSLKAMEEFSKAYWYPLYFAARRFGLDKHDAEDAVQDLFARLIENRTVAELKESKGRLRNFLLVCLKNGIASKRQRSTALKRGGGIVVISLDFEEADRRYRLEVAGKDESSVDAFERKWAHQILDLSRSRLRSFYAASGRERLHAVFAPALLEDPEWDGIAGAADALGMSEGSARVALHRMRRVFGDVLRATVAETVSAEDDVEEEIQYLISLFETK